jgi:hypothetical protein
VSIINQRCMRGCQRLNRTQYEGLARFSHACGWYHGTSTCSMYGLEALHPSIERPAPGEPYLVALVVRNSQPPLIRHLHCTPLAVVQKNTSSFEARTYASDPPPSCPTTRRLARSSQAKVKVQACTFATQFSKHTRGFTRCNPSPESRALLALMLRAECEWSP